VDSPIGNLKLHANQNLPIDHFKLLSLDDKMAENTREWRPVSHAGSLDEFDNTPEEFSRPPLAIGGMSEVARSKEPAYPLYTYLHQQKV